AGSLGLDGGGEDEPTFRHSANSSSQVCTQSGSPPVSVSPPVSDSPASQSSRHWSSSRTQTCSLEGAAGRGLLDSPTRHARDKIGVSRISAGKNHTRLVIGRRSRC